MKIRVIVAIFFVLIGCTCAFAQSSGMRTLKNRFKDKENVHSFKLDGMMARVVFKLVSQDEEIKDAIQEIRSIDIITIPSEAFLDEKVSVRGYKKFLEEQGFTSLVDVRDNGDHVSIFLSPESKSFDRYLIVAEETSSVTVIELKGRIDLSKLSKHKLAEVNL
jgi:hypothetical protein